MITQDKLGDILLMVNTQRNLPGNKNLPQEAVSSTIHALIRNEQELPKVNLSEIPPIDFTELAEAIRNTPVTNIDELVEVLDDMDVPDLPEIIRAVRCCGENME